MSNTIVSKNWVFTWNNPVGDIEWPDCVNYAVHQLEMGENGTYHFQGYVEFKTNKRLTGCAKILRNAHWERRRGTQAQAREYCMKEESRIAGPWEYGVFVPNAQGKRSDLAEACAIAREHGMKRVAEEMPEAYVRNHKGLRALLDELAEVPKDEGFVPRPWQEQFMDDMMATPNDREIFWVYDSKGGVGKSRLALHLQRDHGAIQLSGRIQDMAYAYNGERIVVFDVARTQAENMDHLYSFAEMLKNGFVFSTKYEPKRKLFKPPHVVFFSNSMPEAGKWSADRVRLWNLDEELAQ